MNSLNSHSSHTCQGCGNWGPGNLRNLPKDTEFLALGWAPWLLVYLGEKGEKQAQWGWWGNKMKESLTKLWDDCATTAATVSSHTLVYVRAQSYPTVLRFMDCSPSGFFVHGIFQAGILDGVAISSSRGSSRLSDWTHITCVSCIGRQILYHCATWETHTLGESQMYKV